MAKAIGLAGEKARPRPSPRWHLDEMVVRIGGEHLYLWRAVDDEGEVLALIVQRRRDAGAALKLLKRLARNQRMQPETVATDGLSSYAAALRELDLKERHKPGRLRENSRAENSHLPIRRRERKMQGFRFLTAQAAVYNTVAIQPHLIRRSTLRRFRAEAMTSWAAATRAA